DVVDAVLQAVLRRELPVEIDERLRKETLAAVARDHTRIERDTAERIRNGGLADTFGGGFAPEVGQPRAEPNRVLAVVRIGYELVRGRTGPGRALRRDGLSFGRAQRRRARDRSR